MIGNIKVLLFREKQVENNFKIVLCGLLSVCYVILCAVGSGSVRDRNFFIDTALKRKVVKALR